MNAPVRMDPPSLAKLREPFAKHHISKLPKPYKKDSPKGKCNECGGYHGLPAAHLDYVGHAALTDRLLDTDPEWTWEPLAFDEQGLPAFDRSGGLWIKLTVLGVTRLGYGHAAPKSYGDPGMREKEVIGDALRNAAMRFGAALDLWHKGDLHPEEDEGAGSNAGPAAGGQREATQGEPPAASNSNGDGTGHREKLAGPYTSISQLKTAVREFVHTMQGCEDADELSAFIHSKDALELIEQVKRDMNGWWEGWADQPPEFIPLKRQIEIAEYNAAQRIADIART